VNADEEVLADPFASAAGTTCAGRTALVVGGGLSGVHGSIGFATAWMLAREGARIVVADRDADAGERTCALIAEAGGWAQLVVGDVTVDGECARIVKAAAAVAGRIDALVTTVGRGDLDGILEVGRTGWDEMLAVNLTVAWDLIRSAADVLPPGSTIVTTSSGAAGSRGPATPYNVAKAALEQLTVGAAATLAPRGIRVNAVRVGTIWSTFASRAFDEATRRARVGMIPLRTEGNVWDIAAATTFLTGERSRWITGQVLAVDGGGPMGAPPGHPGAAPEEED